MMIRRLLIMLALTSLTYPATAYVGIDGDGIFCPNGIHWPAHSCKTSSCAITMTPFVWCSHPGAFRTQAETDATLWAFWMYVRESSLKQNLFVDQAGSAPDCWHLFDGRNSIVWQYPINWDWASGNLGLSRNDTTDMCGPGDHEHIYENDLVVRSDHAWADNAAFLPQNAHTSPEACVYNAQFREVFWSHEIGHAYGLDHNDALPVTMNSAPVARGCNRGASYHPQPDADTFGFPRDKYGRNTDNLTNVSASIWLGSNNAITATGIDETGYCGGSRSFNYWIMNYYKPVTNAKVRFILVRANLAPTPGNVAWASMDYSTFSLTDFMTGPYFATINPPISSLALNTRYRLWIWIDPTNLLAESDEGDNLIPTAIQLWTGTSC